MKGINKIKFIAPIEPKYGSWKSKTGKKWGLKNIRRQKITNTVYGKKKPSLL